MKTDPIAIQCDQCGAKPGRSCVNYPTNSKYVNTHKARHVDAWRGDLRREAESAPEGSLLNDALKEVNSRQQNGTLRVSAFLEAVKWMQERQEAK